MAILVVDGMSVLKTISGLLSGFTNGYSFNFFQTLASTIKHTGPIEKIAVCWEGGNARRTEIFPAYKANRKPSNQLVRDQRENFVKPLLVSVGADQYMAPGHEGDDVGAYMTKEYISHGLEVVLLSNDQDWIQLVRPGVSLYIKYAYDGKVTPKTLITADNFQKVTGFRDGKTFLRAKALNGDGSDEIPGIYGVGPTVIKSFLSGGEVAPAKRTRIEEFIASSDYGRNLQLVNLLNTSDLPIQLTPGNANRQNTLKLVTDYKWASILKKFPAWWEQISCEAE